VEFERLREGLGDYRRLLTLDRLAKEKAATPAARQVLADILGGFQLGDRAAAPIGPHSLALRELRCSFPAEAPV
jgi:hypothetical protein